MTHLGKLPSQVGLTEFQQRELLSYHRSKADRESMCPTCSEQLRDAVRKCYWCGNGYSDKHGVVGSSQEAIDDIKAMMGKKPTSDQIKQAVAQRKERLAAAGVALGGTPEGDRVLAELQARRDQAGKTQDGTPGIGG